MKKNNYFLFSNFLIFSVQFRRCIELPEMEFNGKNTENQTKNTFYSGLIIVFLKKIQKFHNYL